MYLSLNYGLDKKGVYILHIEEEADLSKKNLIRFASYHLKLYERYRTEIITLAICINRPNIKNTVIDTEYFKYKVLAIDIYLYKSKE